MLAIVLPEAGVAEAANAMVSGATKPAPSVGAVSATAVGGGGAVGVHYEAHRGRRGGVALVVLGGGEDHVHAGRERGQAPGLDGRRARHVPEKVRAVQVDADLGELVARRGGRVERDARARVGAARGRGEDRAVGDARERGRGDSPEPMALNDVTFLRLSGPDRKPLHRDRTHVVSD